MCGLSPSEFWDLSPHEYHAILDAHRQKKEAEQKETWFYVAHLMWAAGMQWKKSITPRHFLNQKKKRDEELSPLQKREQIWLERQMWEGK